MSGVAVIMIAIEGANREFLYGVRESGTPSVLIDPMFWSMLLLACGVGGLAALIVLATRRDRANHGPLERHLARALSLDIVERRLLRRAARHAGFHSACCVMISRGCFDHATREHVVKHGGAQRLRAIRGRLFDDA